MKKKGSKKLAIFGGWTLGFIILASILVGVSSGEQFKIYELRVVGDNFKNEGSSTTSSSTTTSTSGSTTTTTGFNCDEIQKTQTGKDFCGNVVNSQIYCKVKQNTDVVDSNGKVVGTEQSPFFAGNPITTFEFIDKPTTSDITQGGFSVTAFVKCASDINAITSDVFKDSDQYADAGFFSYPNVKIPLRINEGSLLVKVFSKDSNNVEHETYNSNLKFAKMDLTDPTEKKLGNLKIGSDRILEYIPSGTYDSQQRFALSGNIDIVWRDFPSVVYTLHLDEKDIPTYRHVSVIKSATPNVISCASGEVRQGNVCVKQTDVGSNSPPVTTVSGLQEAMLCVQGGNFSCLLQDKFIPYIVAGFGGLFLIGALTHNSPPRFDQFGNRI